MISAPIEYTDLDDEGGAAARSQSPSERSFEAEDMNKSKSSKGGGLRIKLSLKPLRKSSRERRAHVNVSLHLFIHLDVLCFILTSRLGVLAMVQF